MELRMLVFKPPFRYRGYVNGKPTALERDI